MSVGMINRNEVGDVWTFCAIDADTKLVPTFKVGKRNSTTANAFAADLSSRLKNRVQLSSDALAAYVEAVELAFGADVSGVNYFSLRRQLEFPVNDN